MTNDLLTDIESARDGTRNLATLPKAHLHLHLEAGMRSDTLADLAAKYDLDVPKIGNYGSFTAFSATYELATEVLREPDDWARIADEICADQVADGAVYLEATFWAGHYRHRFHSDEECWAMVMSTFNAAAERHGLAIGYMPAVDRVKDSSKEAMRLAHMAVEMIPDGAVSFGLHNDEVGHPGTPYAEAFAYAKEHGLQSTPHAGELEGPHHVVEAIEVLDADRILHGVRSVEMPGLVERIADAGICLDVCPTSNLLLSIVPDLASHPLPQFLEAGVRCSINGDDPLLFGPGLLDEYVLCREQIGCTDEQMAAIARSSIECGGAPDSVKASAVAGIDAWLT
ncbi:MAG: adenosine deaminase [Ilumatobacter sp.]|uniref:adenosine deaminase n=1 Tax=Ilumatobacter sp. TaxID=1967498 RepID=UPI003296D13A